MTFKASEVIKVHDGGYPAKNVTKRRKLDRSTDASGHVAPGKGLGWKTKFIGLKSWSSVDRFLMKWIGKNYNQLISRLSIDNSYKGRLLRDEVRNQFTAGHWMRDNQNRIQKSK